MQSNEKPQKTGVRTEKTIACETYWTIAKAAEFLGVSTNSARQWCKTKNLKHLKFGTSYFFKRLWLKDFLFDNTVDGGAK